MKKLYLLLLLLLLNSHLSFSQTGWFWQNPRPQGNWLHGVEIIDANTIMIVGDGATVLKSSDGGLTWNLNHYPVGFNARKFQFVRFANSNTGWICGDSGAILKTTNSGSNWTYQPTPTPKKLLKMFFLNVQNGFVCGEKGIVLRTTDGGTSWTDIGFNMNNYYFYGIYFTNNSTGYLCGHSIWGLWGGALLYKTTNAGQNWAALSWGVEAHGFHDIYFINEQTGFAVGDFRQDEPVLIKTSNAGLNWVPLNSQGISLSNTVYFIDEMTGWVNGYPGVFRTTNGSASWGLLHTSGNYTCGGYFDNIKFYNNANIIFGVGCSIIEKSTNSGINWIALSSGDRIERYHIQFTDVNTGWTAGFTKIGPYAGLYKSTNGGASWQFFQMSVGYVPQFYFLNNYTGWIINDTSHLIQTTDGGFNWHPYFDSRYASRIFFLDQTTGYIHRDSSLDHSLYRTTNSGANWENIFNSSTISLEVLQMVNSQVGYARNNSCGGACVQLLKTTNGGYNWFVQTTLPSGYSGGGFFQFINESTGWWARTVGWSSPMSIYKTTDGGSSWINQNLEYMGFTYILKMLFLNPLTGYASASRGAANYDAYLLTTTNGGQTWNVSMPGVANGIYDINFVNNLTGWLCGPEGTIMKTTTGGGLIGISVVNSEMPVNYSLHQNYPNPFNPISKIKFEIPKLTDVKIIVYDLLGREVATLVNELLKPGTYEVNFDGSNFASGIYFYSLITDDFSETKKMVLMK